MSQTVRVKLFAVAKQLAGAEQIELELREGADVRALRAALLEHLPALASVAKQLRFAINNEYAADSTIVSSDVEIACIPPVSGG
jgi:molybdopterin synthase catalytic subunit/molybdopterin synthase sulfur carrier subunit